MPYKRRYNYRRRRYYKRKPRYGYFGKFGNDATKAMKMAGKALALINTEHKHHDITTIGGSPLAINSTKILHLNGIVQGTDDNERIGNSVKNTSLYFREYFTNTSSTDVKIIRRLVVKWLSPNGVSLPTITDILQYDNIVSPRNIDKAKMFKILSDDTIYLPSQTNPRKLNEKYVKLSENGNDDHTEYTSIKTSNLVNTNGYYVIYMSNVFVDPVELEYLIRLRYIDN